jgi:hypothetical protein
MRHDPVLSDLAAELRRDEANDSFNAAVEAATADAENYMREAILLACYSLPLCGWTHMLPGTFVKGDVALMSESDGWWSHHNGRLRGPYPDPHIALKVLES